MENASTALRRKGPAKVWSNVAGRLHPIPKIELDPSFRLSNTATVYTVGSCFARNIEEHLDLIGCTVPNLAFTVPRSEFQGRRANGILNKYTPAAIAQDLLWGAEIHARGDGFRDADADRFRFDTGDGRVIDLQLSGYHPVSESRFYERRRSLFELISTAFTAECLAITLGLIEAWKLGDVFVQQPPANQHMLRRAKEFDFCVLDYETSYRMIDDAIRAVTALNPGVKILITTSPVPLERTFTEDDILVANLTSKSTLRAVSKRIAEMHDNVDYFPSYEMITLAAPGVGFELDMRHVRDGAVGTIVQRLVGAYFQNVSETQALFQAATIQFDLDKPDTGVFKSLRDRTRDLGPLSNRELVTLLRACWRLKDRRRAAAVARELISRPERDHATLRAFSHILPRIGMFGEARAYASDILERDPDNQLAIKIVT